MRHVLVLCIALFGTAIGFGAHASGEPVSSLSTAGQAPYTNEAETQTFTVNADGSYTKLDKLTLRVNTEAGIARAGQYYVWFNREMAHVDILEAWTEDAQGGRHDVRPEQIRDVQEVRSFDAPMFQDVQDKVIVFPAVEPGARVHLTWRKTQRVPLVPGWFSDFTPPDMAPTHNFRVIYDLPASVALHADARGFTALKPVEANGRTRYEYRYDKTNFNRLEYGSVSYVSYGDRLMVSTFPDYSAFAKVYRDASIDASAHDAAVVQLAQSLTAHDATSRAKAQTLYDWVRRNIRYVAINVGRGEIVPHRVTDVLANRYGDCKDHVALFTALLAAVGIRAEGALLNLGPVYSLPSVPGYGEEAINHVIAWLPDLGVFADTSSGGVAFGFLPAGVMDRPAMLVDDGVLVRTPATQPRTRSAQLDIEVGEDGNASYRYRVEEAGALAETERNTFRRATHQGAQLIAAQRLRQTGLAGTAGLTTGPLDATSGAFATTTAGTLDHVVWPDGTTALPALSSLSGGIASQLDNWLAVSRRTQPWACISGDFEEHARITLPAFARVTDLPRDTMASTAALDYSARYVFDRETRTVEVTRRLAAHFGRQMCTPEDFAQMREALLRMQRDAHAQIVVRATAQ